MVPEGWVTYKRWWLGTPSQETHTIGGVVKFFIFCALVVNLLPLGIEAVTDLPLEVSMVPPIWRAEIICSTPTEPPAPGETPTTKPPPRDYKYTLEGNVCTKVCTKEPNCAVAGETKELSTDQIAYNSKANMAESRQDLGIHGIFELVMLVLRYGTVLVALASFGIMKVGSNLRWYMFAAPYGAVCAVLLALWVAPIGLDDVLVFAVGVWLAAYAADMWSTSRFTREDLGAREMNPVMRWLIVRFGVKHTFVVHPVVYGALLVGVSFLMEATSPLTWQQTFVLFALLLSCFHVGGAVNNMYQRRQDRVVN